MTAKRAKPRGLLRLFQFIRGTCHNGVPYASIENVSPAHEELQEAFQHEQFEVYYQPIVRLADNRIIGAEALTRWNHPTRGLIPPAGFANTLYRSALGRAVSYWCLDRACEASARWRRGFEKDFKIAVNTCAPQLAESEMPQFVSAILERHALPASALELEITEDVELDRIPHLKSTLENLKAAAISVAVDDFGTGFASLKHLLNYPISRIKIDRAFVSCLDKPSHHMRTCTSIVEMAIKLGLKVTVEGVETEGQLKVLKELGCSEAQGFLFSKPVTRTEFERLLQHGFNVIPA
ncbi:EAL domain-containing protein [Pseudovibrio sp. SPO723]|uniref:EAL domain-containing protein n=1 Tax=Nesiotobacter zosterae TaxID=392721 RepID=UPI0029C26665|nr:EAL domain-containing protein [Pseudovibrio sp. SPO723]MDX5592394.1 EAL domain-containing protein [Pseudovibrio sp. SPO723]